MGIESRWAVVPTRGDRLFILDRCLAAISPQVDGIVVVDNSTDGIVLREWPTARCVVLHESQQPPNLSHLWNLGIKTAYREDATYVAVLNDDAVVPPTWLNDIVGAMQRHCCVAGSYGARSFVVHRTPGATPLSQRLAGYAFVLHAERYLLADERLQWWCGDNDLDMQARLRGGTVVLAGDPVKHLFPDKSTRESRALQLRTREDMRLFIEKWGFRPWPT